MKKVSALILALLMLFGMLPLNAFAAETTDEKEVTGVTDSTSVNRANGGDIAFANIGTASHPMTEMKQDYLQVRENGEPAAEPEWEIGSIYASSGTNFSSNTRLRTVAQLPIADYTVISVGSGYSITYLVYDAHKNYLGNGSETLAGNWLGDGAGISFDDVLALYPDAVYFRVVLCATNGAEVTLEDVETSGISFRTKEEDEGMWEQGTIASTTGLNNVSATRLRTVDYLLLEDHGGVGINRGYTMTVFVYDQGYNYLGTSSWLGSGVGFETEDLQEKYPDAVCFRIALRAEDSKNISVSDLEAAGVTFYGPGADVPVRDDVIKHTVVGNIGFWQDGAIFGGKFFVFNGVGSGAVYDLDTLTKVGAITLDRTDVLTPHANSVCFGNTYYAEEDPYPLLYINVYNNYASSADRMEGTCCVYRLTETDGVFTTDLVQVIRIGFAEDLTLCKSKENNGDTRPYGNFVVDTDKHKLYAYVMRDASSTTRFFCFDLPALTDGAYNETYGCNVVTLERSAIETYFDTSYFNYLQGGCYINDQIISAEGFSGGTLRIVDLDQQKLSASHSLGEAGLLHEPEVLCIDPATEILYYAAADGILSKLTIPGAETEHTHSYTSVVTEPTCTEQGYTTYTCTGCGYSYVSDYTDKLNLTIIPITSAEVEQGGYYYGRDSKSTTRLRVTDQIYVEAGTTVKYSANGLRLFFAIVSGPDADSYLEGGQWYTDSGEFKVTTDGFLSIIISKPNSQEKITVSDYTADIEIHMISECDHDYQVVVTEPTYSSGGYTTHTCTQCGHRYITGYTDKKIYRILLIGNSFSQDSMREFAAVVQSMMGADFELEIHLAINAAKTLAWHATQVDAGAASYKHRYYFTANDKWTYEDDPLSTLDAIIDSKQWDVITIQSYYPEVNTGTANGLTGESAEFLSLEKSVPYMLDYIHSHAPQSEVYYFMEWQATTDTTHLDAGRESFGQILAMTQVLEEYSGTQTGKRFDGVIPVGTAIQNARSTYLGLLNYTASRDAEVVIGLQRDSVHMSYSIGAYIAALTWAEYLFPEEVRAEGYVLSGVPRSSTLGTLPVEYSEIAQKAVAAAIKNPYTVKALDGYEVDPADVAKEAIESADYCFSGITNETELLAAIQKLVTSHLTKTGFDEPTITLDSYTLKNGVVTDLSASVTFRFGYTTRTVNITRHFHKYTSVVTEPTCTEQGYTTHTSSCGDSYVDSYTDQTEHTYVRGVCSGCGAEHGNLPNYKGKVISILGDSISTFAGYIPGEDGFNLAHRARYPQSNLLTDVNETWWMQVLTALDAKLGINDSWAGSRVINTISGNSGDLGEKAAMASLTRIQNLGSNGTPDVILFYGGTNDIVGSMPLGTFDPDTAPVEADLTAVRWNTVADAYAAALLRMKHFYPDAQIIAMLPTYTSNYYTNAKLEQYNAMFASICSHYGVKYLDLRDCGITTANMPDGIHPDASGMDYITGAVLDMLLNDVEMDAGETTVYSVEHKLTDAKASLSYYKGIRSGQAFVETITGDNLAVTVTMAGKDISNVVYHNGEIRIPCVTGNLVITAEGQFTADGHLQQLPENLCPGINLWTVLENEDMYYTSTGWGYHNHDKVRSVTFSVTPGDKIYATSFGKGTDNGSIEGNQAQADGIRVTFFFADGKVKSMAPGEVYTEFAANGCLTAPAGTIAVCVPMWTPYDSNKLYILSAEHDYEATVTAPTCTEQGYTTYTCACGDSYVDDYVGATGHSYKNGTCTGCGEKAPVAAKTMSMKYDDHLDMTGKTVEILDAGSPVSYQVGYGVAENTVLDTAVVTMKGNTLVAVGIGTAIVKIDGETYEISVTAAPISLLLLIGQSNMQGIDGNASESIVCPTGQVYATYADRYKKTVEDVTKFAPSALTGEYSTRNVTGDRACLENYPVNMLTAAGNGREGMDSGIAYEWVRQTGEKVWTVNVGYGGSSITQWQEGGIHYEACLELFAACQETLRKEIAAGHFTLSHMAYFWCQGCADENQTASWYVDQFLQMHETLQKNMAFDENMTFEFAGIIPIRSGHDFVNSYRAGIYKDTTNVPYYQSFRDLQFNGPRVAQYWMGNHPELKDIWNVCTIQEGWATLPDGSDGVSEYFRSAYPGGVVDYPTQVKQSASWYKPTTPAAVHDNIHYNQIGYNELGRESARNALIMLGELDAPKVTPTVKFLTWDGFTPADQVIASTTGFSGTLVVPMVYPVWKSKTVTYTVTDGLRYEYYDLLAESMHTEGTLTASVAGATVTVAPRELTSFRWDLKDSGLVSITDNGLSENVLSKIAGSVTNGVFSGVRYKSSNAVQLLHTEQWCVEVEIENWTATSGTMLLSTNQTAAEGAPYFYFRPNDFFVGIGCYNGSTYDNYGISLKQHGIACSQGSHTYRFVNRIADDGSNMIYLIVDDVEIGALTDHYVNSTLNDRGNNGLSGKDFSMPYFGTTTAPISNCTVRYIAVTEADYDPDLHLHDWSDWETVTAAGPDGPGEEKRTCPDCGEEQTREVIGVWQTHDLGAHLVSLPEEFCCGTNLWRVLPHDPMYYHSGEKWAKHESGTIHSVTISVNGGDRIFATSFGKYSGNGNTIGTNDGIRVTFFGADGVLKTMEPQQTYNEFAANGGYIVAPEGTVAVNVPMYSNSDDQELYILNRDHIYKNGTCAGCGIADPNTYGAAVVSGGSTVRYQTLDEALRAASAGDTVMLLMDAQTSLAAVPVNVKLDLNGYVLDAAYVACFGHIADTSQDNTGLLKVEKTNFLIQSSNCQIPIRVQDGYRFVEIRKFNQHLYAETNKLAFQPLFEEAAHEPLLPGSEQSGITIGVKISWQHNQGVRSQEFIYNDSQVKTYIESYKGSDRYGSMFTVTLSGAEQLKNLTFQIVVKSECGVEFLSEPIVRPTANSN